MCYCLNNLICNDCIKILSSSDKKQIGTKNKYYNKHEIEILMMNNYGVTTIPKTVHERIKMKKDFQKNQRKELLIEKLGEYRLQIKPYGDCFTFVEYGKPLLDEVVMNELNKSNEYQKRRIELTSRLEKLDIEYNEEYVDCMEYVKSKTHKKIDEVIRNIEIEHFLREHTTYLELIPLYGKNQAQEIALRQYYSDDELDKSNDNINEKFFDYS